MDLNKAQIIGRLTQDPEMRTTPSGVPVTSFSVATNHTYTDKNGQKQSIVEYHDVVAWRKLAEIISQYLKKGRQVYIEGRLQTRSWEGNDGNKKYRTEIIADNMIMLGSGGGQDSSNAQPPEQQDSQAEEIPVIDADADISDEEIPF